MRLERRLEALARTPVLLIATDYRNGVRWHHFDPTKWVVWSLSRVGLTGGLKRVPKLRLARARAEASRAHEAA